MDLPAPVENFVAKSWRRWSRSEERRVMFFSFCEMRRRLLARRSAEVAYGGALVASVLFSFLADPFRRETTGVFETVKASSVASRNQDQDGDWSRTASVLVPAAMFGVVFAVACVSVVALFVSSSSSLSSSSRRSAAS